MNIIKSNLLILFLCFISFCLSCNRNPTAGEDLFVNIKLQQSFSASEFKEAVIGKWMSVFEYQGRENVEYLELSRTGQALIIIKKESDRETFGGDYTIHFPYPIGEGILTEATITITNYKGPTIILSNVRFMYHNGAAALSHHLEMLFRHDRKPWAVLKKVNF